MDTGYDKIWDKIYTEGHEQKAPWDSVVSFVYRNMPKDAEPSAIKILEVGCGTASNLRFFAQEGFQVYGIDAASKAIEVAQNYFSKNDLTAELKVGSFETLPFAAGMFDLIIDRAALVHNGTSVQVNAINEIHRCLKTGGKFLYTPYADTHGSCRAGKPFDDGLTHHITAGTLLNVGHLRFMNRDDIEAIFPKNVWTFINLEYIEQNNLLDNSEFGLHSSWRVIVEKL